MRLNRFARSIAASLMLLGLAGCSTMPTSPETPNGELIVYDTADLGPFCGRCDTLKFAVSSDGNVWIEEGHWAGTYSDWQVTKRHVRVTAEQFDQFRRELVPYRPVGVLALDGPPTCKTNESDLPGVVVVWRGGGADARLAFNFGCDPEIRGAMLNALRNAPAALGLRSPLAGGSNPSAPLRNLR